MRSEISRYESFLSLLSLKKALYHYSSDLGNDFCGNPNSYESFEFIRKKLKVQSRLSINRNLKIEIFD